MSKTQKTVDLALQGGGAHGAFTWGVLDRLLEDERVHIEAISGTSAGAVNAIVLADGLNKAGSRGAREALNEFWKCLSQITRGSFLRRTPWDAWMGAWNLDQSPFLTFFEMMSHYVSPYDVNPFNWNPLRDQLVAQIDFKGVREMDGIELFVTATNVENGRPRVFERHVLTVDHILASACLPTLYQAVLIEGVPYWDGGYMGNPSLWPLFEKTISDDIVIVKVNPIDRKGAPRSARDIMGRLNEITFNASLLREFRAIDFVQRLIRAGRLEGTDYHDVRIHLIADDDLMNSIGELSKFLTEWPFLEMLKDKGRHAAAAWLDVHFEDVGRRSTVNLRAMFQGEEDGLGNCELAPAGSSVARASGS